MATETFTHSSNCYCPDSAYAILLYVLLLLFSIHNAPVGRDFSFLSHITAYWPAMLLSAGISLPDVVFAHGYLTANGRKISKSLGNVVDPPAQVEKYGSGAVRYSLLRGVSPVEDGDYAEKRVRELYNSDLANNLGNLARRFYRKHHTQLRCVFTEGNC